MSKTTIEWTNLTWNPVTGCTKVSQGCKNCYAEVLSHRLKAMGVEKYKNDFKVTIHPEELLKPYKWVKPRMIFVNSMSDLFHKDVPLDFIKKVFKVMNECDQHIFQVLTKRDGRLLQISKSLTWSNNIWMGVSVEDSTNVGRIDSLRQTEAKIKFISFEPLLGLINNVNLTNIDWAIVGGESGKNSRLLEKEWVVSLRDQCKKQKVKFFFKQWGGTNKKKNGRLLDNKIYNEYPKYEFYGNTDKR